MGLRADGFAHIYLCETQRGLPRRDPGQLDGRRAPAFAGPGGASGSRSARASSTSRHREGPPRAPPLPRAPRRHRPGPPHQGGRHAPDARLPGRAVLRRHLLGPRRASRARGLERRRRRETPSPRGEASRRSSAYERGEATNGSRSRPGTGRVALRPPPEARRLRPAGRLPGGGERLRGPGVQVVRNAWDGGSPSISSWPATASSSGPSTIGAPRAAATPSRRRSTRTWDEPSSRTSSRASTT